ncbi:MAG: RnfABCDGE type electron transport complex subunit B, partial [Candidatus Eisenbacteria bacterium]|nr:RnfABCDGE type electron transport complex subunit B [Candidatus Eisenbacteria bacterium]
MPDPAVGIALWGLALFTTLGLVFGMALAAVAMRFSVPVNPLVERVRDRLPAANCGACGFAGCPAYAQAVVERAEVAPNLCAPGRAAVAEAVATLTGKEMGVVLDRVVVLRCHGVSAYARDEAEYAGVSTCAAASLVFGGPKACKNGCLGLGDCVRACPFDALHLGDQGIVEVDSEKCTGCAICVPV